MSRTYIPNEKRDFKTPDLDSSIEHFNIPHAVDGGGNIQCPCEEVRNTKPKPPVPLAKDPRISPRARGRRLLQDQFWTEHEERRRWEKLPLEGEL